MASTRYRLLALLLPLLLTGCATLGVVPSAQFAGMTVETVQQTPGDPNLKLNLGLDFRVKNPMDIKLVVPKHAFGLNVDGAPVAESGVKSEFTVGSKAVQTVRYDFTLDLSEQGLGRAFGKDATFGFTADVEIDVPQKILEILEDQLPELGGLSESAGKSLSNSVTALSSAAGEGGLAKAKLSFEHQGRLKLAKIPKIKARAGNPQPEFGLVGQSETMNLTNLLGELGADIGPLAEFFEQFENARVNQQVDLPVGEILELIGVPSNLTSSVLTAVNGVLSLNGKPGIGSRNNTVTVPVQLPALPELLGALDPQAAAKISAFTDGWANFESNQGQLAGLAIPTALPEGLRFAVPFALDNPNEFSIVAPSFRIGLVDASGAPVLLVQVQKPTQGSGTLTDLQDRRVSVSGQSEAPLELVSEIHWDRLGTSLLELAANPGARLDMSGLQIVGDVTIDPGYGPITLPIRVPLPAPPASPAAPQNEAPQGPSRSSNDGSKAPAPARQPSESSRSPKPSGSSGSTTPKEKPSSGSTPPKEKESSGSTPPKEKESSGRKKKK